MKKIILLLIAGIFAINFISLIRAECNGGVDLDIKKIERSPEQSTFKVVATANQVGDCLSIAWSKNDLSALLNKESPEELSDKDITGDIKLIAQNDAFHTVLDNSEKIYLYSIGEAGWNPFSCNADKCSSKGYSSTDYYVLDTIGYCYCVYKNSQPVATFGRFNGEGDRNGKAIISISGLPQLEINYGQSDGTQSIGSQLTASWRGDLLAGHSITAPQYNVYMDSGGNFHLISSNYQNVKDAIINANGQSGVTLPNCLGKSSGWHPIAGKSQAQNCIDAYNTQVTQLLQDKIQEYSSSVESSIISASFAGSNLIVNEKPYSASYPQFTLTFDAEWAGVHWITGQPKLNCPSDTSFNSGDSKTLSFDIKNVANEKGAFSLSLDCGAISPTLDSNKILLESGSSQKVNTQLTLSTENLQKNQCKIKAYATRDPSKSDECSFNVETKPLSKTTIKTTDQSITSGSQEPSLSKSSTGTTILIIFLILIAGSVGFFIYAKNKKKGHHKEEKEVQHLGKHCTKCGHPLKSGSKFCTKCGKKL